MPLIGLYVSEEEYAELQIIANKAGIKVAPAARVIIQTFMKKAKRGGKHD